MASVYRVDRPVPGECKSCHLAGKCRARMVNTYDDTLLIVCDACGQCWDQPLPPSPKLAYSATAPLERRKRKAPRLKLVQEVR